MDTELKSATSDEVDARIDRRLPSIQDSLELRLTKSLDALLKSRFETATKVLGWSFGLVALVFTIFGVKTAVDIRDSARTVAIEEVRKKLSLDDPNSEVRRDVDRAIARGLISSYYLAAARKEGYGLTQDTELTESDTRRLVELVLNPRTEDSDFRDAINVLLKSDKAARSNHVGRMLVGLASATDEQYKWIQAQPNKRAAIFDSATGGAALNAARAVLADKVSAKNVLSAAIRFLTRTGDKVSTTAIEIAASSQDLEVSRVAVEALARIAPTSKQVAAALKIDPSSTPEAIIDAVRLAAIAVESSFPIGDDPEQSTRNRLAEVTVLSAVKAGFVFGLWNTTQSRKPSLVLFRRVPGAVRYGVPASLLKYDGLKMFASMMRNAGDAGAVKDVIKALCLDSDGRCNGVIEVRFSSQGSAHLSNGSRVGEADAPNGAFLRAASAAADAEIRLSWVNQNGEKKVGELTDLNQYPSMSFTVRSLRDVTDDLEESFR